MNLTGVDGNVVKSGCKDGAALMKETKPLNVIQRVCRSALTAGKLEVFLGITERERL